MREKNVAERPVLDINLDSKTFREFYYLKEELLDFCRKNNLPVSGGKIELSDRIAHFLDTGEVLSANTKRRKNAAVVDINEETRIESDIVCSEVHRAFLKSILETVFPLMLLFKNG